MKSIISILFLLLLGYNCINVLAQIEQGTINADVYYGGPNLWKTVIKAIVPDSSGLSGFGFGPAGIRGDYLLNDNLGVGIDFIYTSAGVKDDATNENVKVNIIRFIPSVFYHVSLGGEVDSYIQAGAGFSTYNFTNSLNTSFQLKVPVDWLYVLLMGLGTI